MHGLFVIILWLLLIISFNASFLKASWTIVKDFTENKYDLLEGLQEIVTEL